MTNESQSGQAGRQEVGWLIEWCWNNSGIHWLSHKGDFTKDSLKAIRFCRKEDAEAFLNMLFDSVHSGEIGNLFKAYFKRGTREQWSINEHIWCDSAFAKTQSPE